MTQDWENYLNFFKVKTPDAEMNAMLNFWNPLQCRTTMYWSRFVSAYESGLGRGMGTRDSAQDILGTVHAAPSFSREVLSKLWHLQFRDGHTWHQFYPLTGEGGPGLAGEFLDWPQWFCDDHLWLIIAVCAYLKETGDLEFLDEHIPYWEGKDHDESVWGHLLRAVDFTYSHRGPHGLPRSGFSDWDDTMNLDHGSGKAESVWCGEQFCRAMLELKELCEFLNRKEDSAHFTTLYNEMAGIINGTSWNGDWYVRAYDDDGMAVGVKDENFHKIGLVSQLWAVIGDIGNHERQVCAMESAHKRLNTPYGLALLWPPYNGSDPRVRGTTTYPPGAKENGGIFCHANAWAIVAAAQLDWGDRAYEYYRQILPLARTDADVYYVEPYVYCQNICGPGHPQFGRGRNAWLTGTASWTYVAGMQWILGIRPTYTGLIISPAIPTSWQGFKAKRVFRGVTYLISVERTVEGVSPSLWVDGKEIFGNIVPFPEKGANQVQVRLTI
jgi:cellobiose phosphorylase